MNNVLETNGVPLTVFGGAVPELAPEDLPEGASPFNQDCDYNPGSVFTRGGRQNQYTFFNDQIQSNPNLGQTLPGAFAPNETPWQAPNNITLDAPLNPSTVVLNGVPAPSNPVLVTTSGIALTGSPPQTPASITTPQNSPPFMYCWGLYEVNAGQTLPTGWNSGNLIGGGNDYYTLVQGSNVTVPPFVINTGTMPQGTVMMLFNLDNFNNVTIVDTFGTNGPNGTLSFTASHPTSAGTVFLICSHPSDFTNGPLDPNQSTMTDTAGDVFVVCGLVQLTVPFIGPSAQFLWICNNPIPNVTPTFTINAKNSAGVTLLPNSHVFTIMEVAHIAVNGIFGNIDQQATPTAANSNTVAIGPISPSYPNSTVFMLECHNTAATQPLTPPAGWGNWPQTITGLAGSGSLWMFQSSGAAAVSFSGTFGGAASQWAALMINFPNLGPVGPYPIQNITHGGSQPSFVFPVNNIAGNMIMLVFTAQSVTAPYAVTGVSDTQGNKYTLIQNGGTVNGTAYVAIAYAQNIKAGANTVNVTYTGSGTGGNTAAWELYIAPQPANTTAVSQVLRGTGYASVPANASILGAEVIISGQQSQPDPGSTITVSLNSPGSSSITTQLPVNSGTITVGTPLTNWNLALTPALVGSAGFGVNVVAKSVLVDNIQIYGLQLRLFLSPSPPANFNWLKTYEQEDGEIDTLLLDSNGRLWDEDVDSNPTVLNNIYNTILPNTFAKSVTFGDIEYIAFSNLVNGTDVPRQWNGVNLDRISMVGPGAAPNAQVTGGAGGSNSIPIANIQQPPQVQIRRLAWGASNNAINDSTPGNLILVFGEGRTGSNTYQSLQPYTATFGAGTTVVLSNITNPFPPAVWNLNGSYLVTAVTTGIVGGSETCPLFEIPAPATEYGRSSDFGSGGVPTSGWFYQSCIATVTTQAPVPNVGVGSTIQIAGTGTPYDGSWTVIAAPNSVNMTISSVILTGTGTPSGGIATYSYTLTGGSLTAPTVGELVSTLNVLNGSGIGSPTIFNVTNVSITAVSGGVPSGTFSIPLSNPAGDIPAQPQGGAPQATAQVGGTTFQFDAKQIVNSGNPVTSGTIVQQGQVATGVRKLCYSFLTRSGFITQPSPIATMNVTSGAGSITVQGLSPGPPNVVARIVFFTGANGGNFFYIPQEVDVVIPGQPTQVNTATIVNDNFTTTAQFSFTDAVLLSATAIDITGNNLFNCIELGSCRGLLTYSSRMVAWSEQQKVSNFRNLSFDGGYDSANLYPLGWKPDSTNGNLGGILFSSPVFGWCYQINNTSGITQTALGMITQPAWHDEFGVPIISAATLYSARITALCTPPEVSGSLQIDLFSPGTGSGTVLGSFSIPLSSMSQTMQIYTGTLLTTVLQPVPKDLVLRVWAANIPNGASIQIDRVEPFQTLIPVNTTAFKLSYANTAESFDLSTGVCGPAQNMQPINGGAVLFDLLYALKEKSWYSTFDNGTTEPSQWNWKEVSNRVGTIGINSYDWGEGWMLTANREGVFFFEGGEPIKVSQEIQPLWDLINWQYGYTIWVRNDPEQRRFTVGVPIATPNPWMPEFPANANPTSPNAIFMCNYRELNTGSALATTGPIRSTYMGRLMSPEPARKWSFWNIQCPYSDYVSRGNNQWPQFYCTGYQDSKVFQLLASQLSDDGLAINSFWISYGFVKPEAADAKGLGLFRMEFPYFTVLAIGAGNLNTYVYPESPFNNPYALDILPLPSLSQGDLELGVNIKGQRFFVRVGTNAVGAWFRCSKMVVPLMPDPWSPIRGYNVLTA